MKQHYLKNAVYELEKIITLLDTVPISKSYGSFDRNYWHYKIKDFSSGMSQEFTLALALAYTIEFEGNKFYKTPRILDFVRAAIEFAIKSSHKEGCTDDYYPYERALGATVFSLYALTEACLVLDIKDTEFLHFFKHRANWIINNDESGVLSNHHAIAATALYNTYLLTGIEQYKTEAYKKLEQIYAWQDDEGWFLEYEGCSTGYLSVTIDYLGQLYKKTSNKNIFAALEKAITFFAQIQHPDGTNAGEYESRYTYLFQPNGFEIMATELEISAMVANSYLDAKQNNLHPNFGDDYIVGHNLISCLNAYKNCDRTDFDKKNTPPIINGFKYLNNSGFLVFSQNDIWAIFNLKKGGIGKIFKNQHLEFQDTGLLAIDKQDNKFVSSPMNPNDTQIEKLSDNEFKVTKHLIKYSQKFATQPIFLAFRIFLFLFGRFPASSRFLRSFFQKKMITGKNTHSSFIVHTIKTTDNQLIITSELSPAGNGFEKVYQTTDLVPIYTAVAECYHFSNLLFEWKELKSASGHYQYSKKINI